MTTETRYVVAREMANGTLTYMRRLREVQPWTPDVWLADMMPRERADSMRKFRPDSLVLPVTLTVGEPDPRRAQVFEQQQALFGRLKGEPDA